MSGATRLTWALFALATLATFGEGGGSVGALLAWHAALCSIVLVVLLFSDDDAFAMRPHHRLWPVAAVFLALAIVGAMRAPYAYAAWLVVLELGACVATVILAASSRSGLPRALLPALLALAAAHGSFVLYQSLWLGRTRPAGTFLNTNHMSLWIVMVLLLAVPWWIAASRRARIFGALALVPALGALAVSASRGAFVGAAVGGAWLVVTYWSTLDRRVRVAVVLLAVVLGAAVGWRMVDRVRNDPFIHHRPLIWKSALGVLADDPLWGSGPGQFPVAAARHRFDDAHGPLRYDRAFRATHSDWLRGPVEYGIPAGLTLVALVAVATWVVRRRRRDGPWEPTDTGAVAALLAFAAQAIVDNPSRWPAAWLLAAILAGRLVATPRQAGAARPIRQLRWVTAAIVGVVFVAAEVVPTVAWWRALPDDADIGRLASATRLNPGHPGYWSRRAQRTLSDTAAVEPLGYDVWLEAYGVAREQAERAVRLQPADARFRLALAEIEARACLARFRDVACRNRVLDHFAAAAERSPFDATIPLEAAEFAGRAGAPDAGRDLAETALLLEPNAVPARLVLAEALLALEPSAAGEARGLVEEAVALAERYPGPAKKSGYARVLLGLDAERAAALLRRTAENSPTSAGRAAKTSKALTYARASRPPD